MRSSSSAFGNEKAEQPFLPEPVQSDASTFEACIFRCERNMLSRPEAEVHVPRPGGLGFMRHLTQWVARVQSRMGRPYLAPATSSTANAKPRPHIRPGLSCRIGRHTGNGSDRSILTARSFDSVNHGRPDFGPDLRRRLGQLIAHYGRRAKQSSSQRTSSTSFS